jgi:integrase
VHRLRREEGVEIMHAALTDRERRVVYIGLCAGLRNQELRGLQRRHFAQQAGALWVSADIAKGARERFVPVLPELEPIAVEIMRGVGVNEYVIPAQRSVGGSTRTLMRELPDRPCSPQAILAAGRGGRQTRGNRGARAPASAAPRVGDHVTRQAGIRAAQAVLGHASTDTTAGRTRVPPRSTS